MLFPASSSSGENSRDRPSRVRRSRFRRRFRSCPGDRRRTTSRPRFVQARRRHDRERWRHVLVDDTLVRHGIDAAVGKRGAHRRQVARGHRERALPRVQVERNAAISRDAPTLRQRDERTSVSRQCIAFGEPGEAVEHERPSGVRRPPGTRPAVAIAGLTIGFVRPSPRSTASSELNARPVALTPIASRTASGPRAAQTRAKTKGFATLMMAKGVSAFPAAWFSPATLVTQMPNWSGAALSSAGYTPETLPASTIRRRSCVSSTSTRTRPGSRSAPSRRRRGRRAASRGAPRILGQAVFRPGTRRRRTASRAPRGRRRTGASSRRPCRCRHPSDTAGRR